MPNPLSQPLEALIASTVALDHALEQQLFAQARHYARIVELRATGSGLNEVASSARGLMAAPEAIRPERKV